MPFWIFKKLTESVHTRKVKHLEKKVSTSFSKVKQDMEQMNLLIERTHNSHKEHETRLQKIEETLSTILFDMQTIKMGKDVINKVQKPVEVDYTEVLDGLTEVQKTIFATIFTIQERSGSRKVSLKSVAQLVYPGKEYQKVRSVLSEYSNTLEGWGLVSKERKGKEVYLRLTEHGVKLVDKIKDKIEFESEKSAKKALRIKTFNPSIDSSDKIDGVG